MSSPSADLLPAVLGQIPSGLAILTARSPDGQETGMLASWVQQAAFEPPAITIAVNKSRYLHGWLSLGSSLAISLLGETQKQMLGHFGKGFDPGTPAFSGLAISRTPSGLPVLTDSTGWLEGTISAMLDAGDHSVLLVQLSAAGAGSRSGTEKPWVHLRKNGLHY